MRRPGSKSHNYTEADYARIAKGDFLPGIDRRSQKYALQRYLDRKALDLEKGKRHKEPELPEWHGYEFSTGKWV